MSSLICLDRAGPTFSTVVVLSLAACGLRTDPGSDVLGAQSTSTSSSEAEGGQDEWGEDDGEPSLCSVETEMEREGSCYNPTQIPVDFATHQGTLSGCSFSDGVCGGEGPENVYVIYPDFPYDISVNFHDLGDDGVIPTLRVTTGDPCDFGSEADSQVCLPLDEDIDFTSFYPYPADGSPYYLIVDSYEGASGDYAFDFGYGQADEEACFQYIQESFALGQDGDFVWSGWLGGGQGSIDSQCRTPGKEDIFAIETIGSGWIDAWVESTEGGAQPSLSVRTGCPTQSELLCASDYVSMGFVDNEILYLAVDNQGFEPGSYELYVEAY